MPHFTLRLLFCIVVVQILHSCNATKKTTQLSGNINSLKYSGGYEIPFNLKFNNTVVGGLSGIDYDKRNDLYYMICDDRSEKNPARFYKAKIYFTENGIDSLIFIDVKYLLQSNGGVYPGYKENRFKTPDPEAIRYNPKTNSLVWSSEGERIIKANDTVLTDPTVILVQPDGKYIDSFVLPPNITMQAVEKGLRKNGAFEGMSFADNFKTLYVNIEEPLYEDGPRADVVENNAFIRIIKYDVNTMKSIAQYAYKLDPVAFAAVPENEFKINGVPDILSIGNNKLLVIERSFSTGRIPCTIKLFIADLGKADDVTNITLKDNKTFTPAKKTLLLNMDELGIYTDNIEGVTFGPPLPNGHRTLLFIADNNFSEQEKAQVLLFEILN